MYLKPSRAVTLYTTWAYDRWTEVSTPIAVYRHKLEATYALSALTERREYQLGKTDYYFTHDTVNR